MAFSLIAHTVGAQGGSTTTPAIDTTGANLIVVTVGCFGASAGISDSKGNTWTALTSRGAANFFTRIYYCLNPTVGSGHTFTQGSGFPTVCVTAWSGAHATSVFDVENGATANPVTSLATGSVTPANANSLVIASIGASDSTTAGSLAISGGFTISDKSFGNTGVTESGAQAYLIQTSIAAANPTWSSFSSGDTSAAIAVFIAAAVASIPWQNLVQDNQPLPDTRIAVAI